MLDASAVVSLLLNLDPEAQAVRDRVNDPDETLHAPHLLDVEVLHVLRRYALGGSLSREGGTEALEELTGMNVIHYPHAPLLERVWELRENLTAYDAAYVALAEALDAPLVTTDGKLARSPGHNARIELYP